MRPVPVRAIVLSALFLSLAASRVDAVVWTVGEGILSDYSTVSEALTAASSGDTVRILPGDYEEPDTFIHVTNKSMTILGAGASPDDTRLRVYGLAFGDGGVIRIENICIHNGGGLVVADSEMAYVRNCTFRENQGDLSGVLVTHQTESLIEDCIFERNEAMDPEWSAGGAVNGGRTTIRNCLFVGNRTDGSGGAVEIGAWGTIENCIFIGNEARYGAAVTVGPPWDIRGCTFYGNVVTSGASGALRLLVDSPSPIVECIFAGTIGGAAIECWGGGMPVCCDFWDNEYGRFVYACYGPESLGNFEADPLFCDPGIGDLGLAAGSPCLPGTHGGYECGQIGARGLGCGYVLAKPLTWGRLRAIFR